MSKAATVALTADGQALRVTGDATSFGDQFASMPIPVERQTDYLLRVAVRIEQPPMVAKVASADRRILLISDSMEEPNDRTKKKARKRARRNAERGVANDVQADDAGVEPRGLTLQMPFASGNRSEVRLVITNNGQTAARPVVEVGSSELFELGPTPQRWTRGVRLPVRGIQRNLFTTWRMLPLAVTGIFLLALAGRKRELGLLLAVPVYYLCAQAAFHTEYRYILAIHYFLFVLAAVTLYLVGAFLFMGLRRVYVALRHS